MDLDKYRRTPTPPAEPSVTSTNTAVSEAPALGSSVEGIRQKANRYRNYVQDNVPTNLNTTDAIDPTAPESPTIDKQPVIGEAASPRQTKGNTFKSKQTGQPCQKLTVAHPSSPRRKEPSSLSGVKIVFLDETMREEYIQIAGYLMVKYRVKLTMTAYFCFLHEQAISQQSDETFLTALAQFARSGS